MDNVKTVLIIEDEFDLRRLYGAQIEKAGYTVVTARDGLEGLESAKTNLPDLIILDLILPKMNGFEVLKNLKRSEETTNIPVIVLSNLGQYDDIKLVKSLGARGYFIKSRISLRKLVEKVSEII